MLPFEHITLPDADLTLLSTADLGVPPPDLLAALIAQTTWRSDTIRLYGKSYAQPRLTAWHGDPGAAYRYSGLLLQPEPWTTLLADLRHRIATLAGAPFNSVLLNHYRDGRDSMGLHSDNEPELGPDPVIASLSLGAERRIVFRHITDRTAPITRIALPSGSLLLMRGPTQRHWKHGIDKQRRPCGPRLNLTFRSIRSHPN